MLHADIVLVVIVNYDSLYCPYPHGDLLGSVLESVLELADYSAKLADSIVFLIQ